MGDLWLVFGAWCLIIRGCCSLVGEWYFLVGFWFLILGGWLGRIGDWTMEGGDWKMEVWGGARSLIFSGFTLESRCGLFLKIWNIEAKIDAKIDPKMIKRHFEIQWSTFCDFQCFWRR